jgi:hypothetical protein
MPNGFPVWLKGILHCFKLFGALFFKTIQTKTTSTLVVLARDGLRAALDVQYDLVKRHIPLEFTEDIAAAAEAAGIVFTVWDVVVVVVVVCVVLTRFEICGL